MAQMLSFHTHTPFVVEHILGITQHWRIEKCLKLKRKKKKRHSSSNKLNLIQTNKKVVQVFRVSDVSCNRTTDNSGRHTMHYSLHSWYHKVSLPSFSMASECWIPAALPGSRVELSKHPGLLHRRFYRATPRKDNQLTSCCTVASCCSIKRGILSCM